MEHDWLAPGRGPQFAWDAAQARYPAVARVRRASPHRPALPSLPHGAAAARGWGPLRLATTRRGRRGARAAWGASHPRRALRGN